MKINKLFTAGVLALAFGLILAGCSTDDDGGGVNNNGGNNNGTNNPFNATSWSGADYDGDSVTLSFTGSAWTLTYPDLAYTENGSYTYSGNVATFQSQGSAGTATISGNSLTVTVNGSTMMTLTRGSGNNNPGGGNPSVPSAPTGVTASRNPAGSTTITVSWNAVSGATGYKVGILFQYRQRLG